MNWSALLCVFAIACGGDAAERGAMNTGGDSSQPTQPFRLSAPLVLASACIYKLTAATGGKMLSDCTGFETLLTCAREKCSLDACIAQCSEYITCLDQAVDPCDETCAPSPACGDCVNKGYTCNFMGPCGGMVTCAQPVKGGFCDELRTCCNKQTPDNVQRCLMAVDLAEKVSGEPSCFGAMHDEDVLRALTVPCNFKPLPMATPP